MGSKTPPYDEDYSNGESSRNDGNNSMTVNVNDTHSDIDNHSNYSHGSNDYDENDRKSRDSGYNRKKSKREDSNNYWKKSPAKDSKPRSKVDVQNTRYLWVSGIPLGTKTIQLEEFFAEHGKVLATKIIHGANDTLLGFVKLDTVDQAKKCMSKLDKAIFRGKQIEITKERPPGNKKKETEKIGFRDAKKYIPDSPIKRSFRPIHRGSFRGGHHSSSRNPRISRRSSSVDHHHHHHHDMRRQDREEAIEREKQKLKLERLRLERERAELLKIERESSRYDAPMTPPPPTPSSRHNHDDKRVRSMVKRPFEDSFINEKRYDNFERRDDFRRYDSRHEPLPRSPDRKIGSGGGGSRPSFTSSNPSSRNASSRYDDNHHGSSSRHERYSDHKSSYDSNKNWTTMPDNSWMNSTSAGERWNTSTNFETLPPRIISSNLGSTTSMSRLNTNSDLSQNFSTRYSSFNRSRY